MTNEITIPNNAQELVFNVPAMDQMQTLAAVMAKSTTLPKELRNEGDCMAICMQSALWKMNPFAVAQGTFFVSGKIGYEGKLINAAVTNSGAIDGRIKFEYFGDWTKVQGKFIKKKSQAGNSYNAPGWNDQDELGLGVKVIATLTGESEPSEYDLHLNQCQPRNSTLWATNPKHQITYTAVRFWARMYCPEVILGVFSNDELEESPMKEINPVSAEEKPRSFAAPVEDIDVSPLIEKIHACTNLAALDDLVPECQKIPTGTEAYHMVGKAYKSMRKSLKQPVEQESDLAGDFTLPVEHISQAIAECKTVDDLAEVEPLINEHSGDDLAKLMKEYAEKVEAVNG